MLAGYNIRRSSVVLNPRGRVLGGGYEGEGTGVSDTSTGVSDTSTGVSDTSTDLTAAEAAFNAAQAASAQAEAAVAEAKAGYAQAEAAAAYAQQQSDYEAASLAAANAAAYAQQQSDYEAASLAAADAAAFAAAQIANEAALVAASKALEQSKINNATTAKTMSTIVNTAVGFLGPIGMIAGLISRATGFVENAFRNSLNNQQLSYDKNIKSAEQALTDARGSAGSDAFLTAEINKVQANLDAAKKAGVEAAVTQLYRTYAKRDPDPGSLAYWSKAFGPSVTSDEVFAFQEALYRNEPNLRPVAVTTQTTTTTQSSNNLALPIIAAVVGFLIFGS